MLPFGHLAAGYLLSQAVSKTAGLPSEQTLSLTLAGTFFAFAPDLDFFYAFAKERSFTIKGTSTNHRDYWTHRPLLWLAASALILALADSTYWRWFAIMIWVGTWSHFLLDSFRTGVRWLWPFVPRFFALKDPGLVEENPAKGFFRHWINMIRMYKERAPLAFYLEIAIVLIALFKLMRLI